MLIAKCTICARAYFTSLENLTASLGTPPYQIIYRTTAFLAARSADAQYELESHSASAHPPVQIVEEI